MSNNRDNRYVAHDQQVERMAIHWIGNNHINLLEASSFAGSFRKLINSKLQTVLFSIDRVVEPAYKSLEGLYLLKYKAGELYRYIRSIFTDIRNVYRVARLNSRRNVYTESYIAALIKYITFIYDDCNKVISNVTVKSMRYEPLEITSICRNINYSDDAILYYVPIQKDIVELIMHVRYLQKDQSDGLVYCTEQNLEPLHNIILISKKILHKIFNSSVISHNPENYQLMDSETRKAVDEHIRKRGVLRIGDEKITVGVQLN